MDRRLLAIGIAIIGLSLLAVGIVVTAFVSVGSGGSDFEVVWESDAATTYQQSYHGVAVAESGSEAVIAVPADGEGFSTDACGLAGYSASGDRLWEASLASEACSPHAVGRTAVATLDGESTFLVTTEAGELVGVSAMSGVIRFRADLAEPSVAKPATGDLTGDGHTEVVVTDFGGTVYAFDANGAPVWTRSLNGSIATGPAVRDVTGDEQPEVTVATRQATVGHLTALGADGTTVWRQETEGLPGGVTTTDDRGRPVLPVGEGSGTVAAYDATDGERLWEAVLQDSPLRVGDASEGRILLGGGGKMWALDLGDGNVAWNQGFGGDNDAVTEPDLGPAGQESSEVLIAARDGTVGLVSVATGGVDSVGTRTGSFEANPGQADLTGDDRQELVLLRADGTVVILRVLE